MQIGSSQDVAGGRLIPTLSTSQYAATLVRWFGVEPALISQVAPDIVNFAQQDLGFMP